MTQGQNTPVDVVNFYNKYHYEVTQVPILGGSYRSFGFIDPLVFCVHPSNPIDYLTLQQIDSIMSVTRNRGGADISTWGDLGLTGEWHNKTIQIHSSSVYQGFEEFARQKILNYDGKRGVWKYPYATNSTTKFPLDQNQAAHTNVHWYPFIFDQDNGIAADKYGFGYGSLAYIDSPVKIIGIKDDFGTRKPGYPDGVTPLPPPITGREWHAPTYDELAAATYPLVRVNTWTTNNKPNGTIDPILEEFTRYMLSYEGQQVTLSYGIFMPLRAHQAADALSQWYEGGNDFNLNK